MIIQSCAFTIHFPQNPRIREHLFDLEAHLMSFQKPFTLVPLPPDAPVEIPRIIATTQHGHSQLTFCGNNAQLVTRFDGEYRNNIGYCINYIREKCESILSALSIIDESKSDNPKFYFSGLSMTVLFDATDGIENPVEYISKKFLNCKSNLLTDEIQFRFALVVEAKYYVNVMVQNYRAFAGVPDERGSLAGLKSLHDCLQVTLDINDRYAFNHEKNYLPSRDSVNDISSLAEIFVSKYLTPFIKNGEIRYAE